MKSHRIIVVWLLVGLVPLTAGCGRSKGLERLPLHGTVTPADGEKLNGSITFVPAKGQPGPAAKAGLTDGRYTFDRGNGPTAGPHSVTVTRAASKAIGLEAIAEKKPIPKMKTQWTQTADVVDDGNYRLDFTLKD